MKKIVLFADGTGNSSSNPQKTNVWRAYQALDRRPGRGQVAFYDNGVGTSSFRPMAILGKAFGFGLARNVQQIYRFVCQTYEKGDKIYGFGFSRGAFTMRVVTALICNQGIIDIKEVKDERDLDRKVRSAYHRFRKESFTSSMLSWPLRRLRDGSRKLLNELRKKPHYDPEDNIGYDPDAEKDPTPRLKRDDHVVEFIGVWDTVDAYGMPFDELRRAWDMIIWPLTGKDRDCSPRVKRVCQALALDEQRESFEPTLWNEKTENGGSSAETIDKEGMTQVWFPGVHSNVGGSYPDDSLALLSLDWMLDRSTKDDGLQFLPEERRRIKEQANWNGPLYDSREGIGRIYRYAPRNLERLCQEEKPGLFNWLKQYFGVADAAGGGAGVEASVADAEPGGADRPQLMKQFTKKLKTLEDDFDLKQVDANEVRIATPKIHHSVFRRIKESGETYAPINLPEVYAVVHGDGTIEQLHSENEAKPAFEAPQDEGATEEPTAAPEEHRELETREQATTRRTHQGYAWNKVWALKAQYIVTGLVIVAWIFYPWLRGTPSGQLEAAVAPYLGTFAVAVREAPSLVGLIPGAEHVANWIADYTNFPYMFVWFIVAIVFCFKWQINTRAALGSEMGTVWHHLTGKSSGPPALDDIGGRRRWLAAFLDSRLNAGGKLQMSRGDQIARVGRNLFEAIAVVLLFTLVLVVAGRFVVIFADGAGGICKATEPDRELGISTASFDPTSFCFDTGFTLEADKNYAITIQISNDWSDKGIDADINGWFDGAEAEDERPETDALECMGEKVNADDDKESSMKLGAAPWQMPLAVPLRRHLFMDWYVPMATIGNVWFDRYPLAMAAEDSDQPERLTEQTTTITARRSGRLFLHLNDAIFFYGNNRGCADVKVVELSAADVSEAEVGADEG